MGSQKTIKDKIKEIILVSEDEIKLKTPMSANKVTTSLINFITLGQDLYIKKTLGNKLYTQLINEWVASLFNPLALPDGTITGTPPLIVGDTTDYQSLYDEIKQPLIWYSYVLSLPHIAIRVAEAGITLGSTEYSQSAGLVGLDRLVAEGRSTAQAYMELLKKYICDTFKSSDDLKGATNVGGASFGVFVPNRNHHSLDGCSCNL